MTKEPKYKDLELLDLSGEPSGYSLRVFKLNKKSASCKIAKDGNFDPCTKPQPIKLEDNVIKFVNYFRAVSVEVLEKKYED